ncbi:MAG: CPBP family intramembrane metalloprotease [Geminocystis sp.]|nr:CPBP family intramembrane metalloprotease [Geminocystis sp.]MDW8116885.1 CPBP family intramembrane glutamic endopeptidase [Geminocystis sp.]
MSTSGTSLHSLVRIAFFLIIWAVIWLPIALAIVSWGKWQTAAPNKNPQKKLILLFPLYSLTPFLIWQLGLKGTTLTQIGIVLDAGLFQSILSGYVLAIASLSLVYLWEWGLGLLRFSPSNPLSLQTTIFLAAVGLFVAVAEESVFRGLFLYWLWQDYSRGVAATISSFLFAILHLIWERENTIPQLPGLWLLGMVLCYARSVDDNLLGMAIGLHGGWVFALAYIDSCKLICYKTTFPSWLVGSIQKPLASLAGIGVMLLAAIALHFMA